MKLWNIFAAFFRVGILGFGGGPSSIPLFHKEAVGKYKWMNDDEFSEVLALGNALPGPIATKMAGYIGYRVGGVSGLIVALAANIVPTVIIMILLLTVFNAYKDKSWVQGMSQAVVPVVMVMLAVLTWDFFKKSYGTLGWIPAALIIVIAATLIHFLGVHPAFIILALLLVALFKKDPTPEKQALLKKERTG